MEIGGLESWVLHPPCLDGPADKDSKLRGLECLADCSQLRESNWSHPSPQNNRCQCSQQHHTVVRLMNSGANSQDSAPRATTNKYATLGTSLNLSELPRPWTAEATPSTCCMPSTS